MLLSQLGYIAQLWSSNTEKRTAAANVAPYYVLNNLFVFAFTMLWVRSYFWGAEIIDIANVISQSTVYWKNPGLPTVIHLPAIAGPYAWSLSALFWNGAVAAGGDGTAQRIAANVFIWIFFVVGQGHIVKRRDQQMGYSLSALSLCKLIPSIRRCSVVYLSGTHSSPYSSRPEAVLHQDYLAPVDLLVYRLRHLFRVLGKQLRHHIFKPQLLLLQTRRTRGQRPRAAAAA